MEEEKEKSVLQRELEITIDIMLNKLSELSDDEVEYTSQVIQSHHGYLATLFHCSTYRTCKECEHNGVCMMFASIDTLLFIEKAKRRNTKTSEVQ